MPSGNMVDPSVARAVNRDLRDAELDVRRRAERCSSHLRDLLGEGGLIGLRNGLARRARLTNDASRFDDDVEIIEAFVAERIRDIIRGAPARPLARLELALGDDDLLGTPTEVDR